MNLNSNITITTPRSGVVIYSGFLKSAKKVEFVALLKQKFYFVPRGTNVENYLLLQQEIVF